MCGEKRMYFEKATLIDLPQFGTSSLANFVIERALRENTNTYNTSLHESDSEIEYLNIGLERKSFFCKSLEKLRAYSLWLHFRSSLIKQHITYSS